jgi:hypothetical protein
MERRAGAPAISDRVAGLDLLRRHTRRAVDGGVCPCGHDPPLQRDVEAIRERENARGGPMTPGVFHQAAQARIPRRLGDGMWQVPRVTAVSIGW